MKSTKEDKDSHEAMMREVAQINREKHRHSRDIMYCKYCYKDTKMDYDGNLYTCQECCHAPYKKGINI